MNLLKSSFTHYNNQTQIQTAGRQWVVWCLITVSKTTHTTHHTKNVVVGGIHAHLGAGGSAHGIVGHCD